MKMKDFNIFACGGCGIDNLTNYMNTGKQSKFVDQVVALDFSRATKVPDNLFEVVCPDDTEGSGSNKATNVEKVPDLIKRALSKVQPNKLNIVISSASGGSGAVIAPYLIRELIEKGYPVLTFLVGDMTSIKEMNNTVGTLRSLDARVAMMDAPILFCYRANTHQNTQGAVNKEIAAAIDSALIMFNLTNNRIDYADVKNFFFFNKVVDADPILTQLVFSDHQQLAEYKRRPVAALSLFSDVDEITTPFENLLYRKAGIFSEHTKGYVGGLHAILDHGSTVGEVEAMIKDQETKLSSLAGSFKSEKKVSVGATESGDFL